MAGFHLSSAQYDALTAMYPSPFVDKPVCWKAFVDEVNLVFSKPNLERNPLEEVDPAPDFLLDPARFTTRSDTVEGSEALDALLERIAQDVRLKRVDVLPFFGDACANQNSPMRVKHVTPTQFAAVLKTQVARDITEAETKAIVDAFGDGEMVNFAAFAATVDPREPPYHAYRRSAR